MDTKQINNTFSYYREKLNQTTSDCSLTSLQESHEFFRKLNDTHTELVLEQLDKKLFYLDTLDYAPKYGCIDKVTYLYEHNLLPSCTFPVALVKAARAGQQNIICYLIRQGVNLDTGDESLEFKGQLATEAAVYLKNHSIINILLQHGAKVSTNVENYIVNSDDNALKETLKLYLQDLQCYNNNDSYVCFQEQSIMYDEL